MILTTKIILILSEKEGIAGNSLLPILEQEGYTVNTIVPGKNVEKLSDEPSDVIIIDTKIPLRDSIHLITAARSLNPEVIVILVTIHSNIETITEARKGLNFDYVVNSFEPKTIMNCINASAKRHQVVRNMEMLAKTPRILIVDDETMITNLFEMSLNDEGFHAEIANCGRDALEMFKRCDYDVVVTDIMMPDINGVNLIEDIKKMKPETAVVVITGYPSIDTATEFIRLGAHDYLTKPLNPDVIISTITRVWSKRLLELQKEELLKQVQNTNYLLSETNLKLKDINIEAIRMLARACEVRDEDTGNHVLRIDYYSTALAREMGLDESFIDNLGPSSVLHDIGKIHIPDFVLKKEGAFTAEERGMMKKHPAHGERILGNTPFFQMAGEIARWHHENWDGTGYPDGLKGKAIPLSARIVRLADTYDSLVMKRPYKQPWPEDVAYKEIIINSGVYFDPEVVDAFQRLYEKGILQEIKNRYS